MDTKVYNLGPNVEFLEYRDEKEWHALRKDGIGGSDIGAVLKLNKYTSPYKLYRIKKGLYAEDVEDNVYIKKGKALESYVFENYVVPEMDGLGYTTVHPEHVFVNKQYPWLRANCDGLAVPRVVPCDPEKNVVIEIKWVSEYAEVNWNGEDYYGVPASYYAQVQHYMTVTGASSAKIFALFDSDWSVKVYDIPYNPSFCCKLISQSKTFHDNLLADIEPELVPTLDKDSMPEALEVAELRTIVKSEELDEKIAQYLAIKANIKALELELDNCFNDAVNMYLNGKRPAGPFKMSISNCKRSGFDTKQFEKDHPDTYSRYRTVIEYSRTNISKA